ncbi:MAG: hypothetical protein IKF14_13545 [Atopobiaceae bacterium]|nr:hypothetical protein [Atopobiaceae bacterium]
MSLEEAFGVCVFAALAAFCAGWLKGDTAGYSRGYHDGWNLCSLECRMSMDDGKDEDD